MSLIGEEPTLKEKVALMLQPSYILRGEHHTPLMHCYCALLLVLPGAEDFCGLSFAVNQKAIGQCEAAAFALLDASEGW